MTVGSDPQRPRPQRPPCHWCDRRIAGATIARQDRAFRRGRDRHGARRAVGGRCVRRSASPELLVEGRYPPTGPSVASWQGLRLLRRNGEYRGGRRRRDRLGEVNQLLDAIAVPPAPGAPSTRREPNGALAGDGGRTGPVRCPGGGVWLRPPRSTGPRGLRAPPRA